MILLILFLSSVALATSTREQWQIQGRAAADSLINLHFFLHNPVGHSSILEIASRIADPTHTAYRQHLDAASLQEIIHPGEQHVEQVAQWLESGSGLSNWTLHGDVLETCMKIAQAEALLNTTYNLYTAGSRTIVRTDSYSLPPHLQDVISHITPATAFPPPSRNLKAEPRVQPYIKPTKIKRESSCDLSGDTTPDCIKRLYNITYIPAPNRTTFAVFATEAASFSPGCLQKYLETYNPPAAAANAQYTIIGSGDSSEGTPGITGAFETALDTQTLLGLTWPASAVLYNIGGVFGPKAGVEYDPFVTFLSQLVSNETVPSVVSFSESMPEDQLDAAYAQRLCTMMAAVGARGVTLVFSSGDNGPQGDVPTGKHNAVFETEFPASCPWVLAVGGTTNLESEEAATQTTIPTLEKVSFIASGGGFSNLFPAPDYQNGFVQPYVQANVPQRYYGVSSFNASGRGVPDVSAVSTKFPVVVDGLTIPIGGTSASTPVWAAVIALLNDYEASKCRPPLGFVNPWLYSLGSGNGELKDITQGGNNVGACLLISGCTLTQVLGYDTTTSWDPVTGLGSPIFPGLIEALDKTAITRKKMPF